MSQERNISLKVDVSKLFDRCAEFGQEGVGAVLLGVLMGGATLRDRIGLAAYGIIVDHQEPAP